MKFRLPFQRELLSVFKDSTEERPSKFDMTGRHESDLKASEGYKEGLDKVRLNHCT